MRYYPLFTGEIKNFNFTEFYKKCILEHRNKIVNNPLIIKSKLNEYLNDKKDLNNKIKLLNEKLENINKLKDVEKREIKNKKNLEKGKLKQTINNINDLFPKIPINKISIFFTFLTSK